MSQQLAGLSSGGKGYITAMIVIGPFLIVSVLIRVTPGVIILSNPPWP